MSSLQNLFVAKLPRNLTDADLQQIFAAYNPSSAKIMLDATTGKSKGFGFVLFDSVEKGEKAYADLNKTQVTLHGHSFTLAIFPSKHDGKVATEVSNCLYIRNIPKQLSQLEVENFLKGFGKLAYCAMREDHHGSPVWVVYAEYEDIEDAKNALTRLHNNKSYFDHSAVPVLAKYSDSEEAKRERRKRRETHFPGQQQHQGAPQDQQQQFHQGSGSGRAGPAMPNALYGDQSSDTQSPVPPPMGGTAPMHVQGYNSHFYTGSPASPSGGYPAAANMCGPQQGMASFGSQPPQMAPSSFGGAPGRQSMGYNPSSPPRFAPPPVANAQQGEAAVSSPMDLSGSVGAFGANTGATTMLPSQQPPPPHARTLSGNSDSRNGGHTPGAAPAALLAVPGCGGGPAPAGGSVNANPNPTLLASSFLNVTFPTTNPQNEHSSNGRGTPVTPLSFAFDPDSDNNQPAPTTGPNGSFRERSPMRNLSSKSLTGTNGSGTRYRHNPYAPVTPISSVPSSAGPSTPRMPSVNVHHSANGSFSGRRPPSPGIPSTAAPPQPYGAPSHYGGAHVACTGAAISTGSHFSSTGGGGYLAAHNGRDQPQ